MTMDRVRVGEVLKLVRTHVEPDPTRDYVTIGVRSFGKGIFHYEPKAGDQLGKLRFFKVQPNRLVVSNIKGWEGAIAVSSTKEEGCLASSRFLTYAPVDDRIDVGWARWFFLSERGLELIQRSSPGSADRNRTLAIERFENLEIPLPPLQEQRTVAGKLDFVQRTVAHTAETLADGGVSCIVEVLPDLTDEIIRAQASTWIPLGTLAEFVSDTVHPGDDPWPADRFIGLQHIESHTGRRLGSDPLRSMKGRKFRFRPGDVVYGYLRPYLNKAWLADCDGLCSVDQYVLRPRSGVSSEILAFALRGRSILRSAMEQTHSLQLPRLRSALLGSMSVPVIPESCTAEVVARLERVRDLTVAISQRRAKQVQTATALLPSSLNAVFKWVP